MIPISLDDQLVPGKGKTRLRWLNVPVVYTTDNLVIRMKAKIDSIEGSKIYPQRLVIVEPVFANIHWA